MVIELNLDILVRIVAEVETVSLKVARGHCTLYEGVGNAGMADDKTVTIERVIAI